MAISSNRDMCLSHKVTVTVNNPLYLPFPPLTPVVLVHCLITTTLQEGCQFSQALLAPIVCPTHRHSHTNAQVRGRSLYTPTCGQLTDCWDAHTTTQGHNDTNTQMQGPHNGRTDQYIDPLADRLTDAWSHSRRMDQCTDDSPTN